MPPCGQETLPVSRKSICNVPHRELGITGQFALQGCIPKISADRQHDDNQHGRRAQSEPSATAEGENDAEDVAGMADIGVRAGCDHMVVAILGNSRARWLFLQNNAYYREPVLPRADSPTGGLWSFRPRILVPSHIPRPKRASSALSGSPPQPDSASWAPARDRQAYSWRQMLAGRHWVPFGRCRVRRRQPGPQRDPAGRIAGIACRGPLDTHLSEF